MSKKSASSNVILSPFDCINANSEKFLKLIVEYNLAGLVDNAKVIVIPTDKELEKIPKNKKDMSLSIICSYIFTYKIDTIEELNGKFPSYYKNTKHKENYKPLKKIVEDNPLKIEFEKELIKLQNGAKYKYEIHEYLGNRKLIVLTNVSGEWPYIELYLKSGITIGGCDPCGDSEYRRLFQRKIHENFINELKDYKSNKPVNALNASLYVRLSLAIHECEPELYKKIRHGVTYGTYPIVNLIILLSLKSKEGKYLVTKTMIQKSDSYIISNAVDNYHKLIPTSDKTINREELFNGDIPNVNKLREMYKNFNYSGTIYEMCCESPAKCKSVLDSFASELSMWTTILINRYKKDGDNNHFAIMFEEIRANNFDCYDRSFLMEDYDKFPSKLNDYVRTLIASSLLLYTGVNHSDKGSTTKVVDTKDFFNYYELCCNFYKNNTTNIKEIQSIDSILN